MFCIAAPRAVSIARANRPSVRTRSATAPCTPCSAPWRDSLITTRTAFPKPSYSFSMSMSMEMRESVLRSSTICLVRASFASPLSRSRFSMRIRCPSMTFRAEAALSSISARRASISPTRKRFSSTCPASAAALSACSLISPAMRSALCRLFSMFVRSTAASASSRESSASASERRLRPASASRSCARIRSLRLSLRP